MYIFVTSLLAAFDRRKKLFRAKRASQISLVYWLKSSSMSQKQPTAAIRLAISIALYILINATSRFSILFAGQPWAALLVPSPATGVALLLLGVASSQRRSIRLAGTILSVLHFAIVLLYGFGESTTQVIYQRSFDPRIDIAFVSVGLDLLFPDGNPELYEIIAITLFSLVSLGIAALLVSSTRSLIVRARPFLLIYGGITLPIALTLMLAGVSSNPFENLPDSNIAAFEATSSVAGLPSADMLDEIVSGEERFRFSVLEDRDVMLFFVESYGATAFSNDRLSGPIGIKLDELAKLLDASDFLSATWFLDSPVSGGFSWIAEATFLTGRWIPTQAAYDRLLESDLPSLPSILSGAGYFTFLSMPAIVKGEWPEGIGFYGYDDHFYSWDYGYQGPLFSYVAVPDQFSIWKTHLRLVDIDGPAFVQHVLVSSHAPFNIIPTFEPDWESLDDGAGYHDREQLNFDNGWLRGNEFDEGYVASINYVLETIVEYIVTYMDPYALAVIVGDHQPKRPVRETDAGKAVPIHLISRNAELIGAFTELGYSPGLKRSLGDTYPRMNDFFSHFFVAAGSATRGAADGSPESAAGNAAPSVHERSSETTIERSTENAAEYRPLTERIVAARAPRANRDPFRRETQQAAQFRSSG